MKTVSGISYFTVFVCSMIAITAIIGAYGIIIDFEQTHGVFSIEVKSVELTMVGDGRTSDAVHCNMVFTADKTARLLLTGDVREMKLPWSGSGIERTTLSDGARVISYDGLLLLNEPASAGDEIEVVIRYGGSETAVTATLEAAA